MIYAQSKFTAVGSGSNSVAYSTDGIVWTGLGTSIFIYGLSSSAYLTVKTSDLSSLSSGDSVTSWNGFTQSTTSQRPTYYNTGSGLPYNPEYVTFSSASSQHLVSTTPFVLNCATNGFSIIAIAKFTGTPQNYERIFDFGIGAGSNNLMIARNGTSNVLYFSIFNGGGEAVRTNMGFTVTQNTWYAISVVYNNTTNILKIFVNGVNTYTSNVGALINRTTTTNYIGRSNWGGD